MPRAFASAVGLTAALALTGCSLIPTLGDAIAPHVTASPSAEATSGVGYEAINLGAPPAQMTPPGTALALGQGAWIAITSADAGGAETAEPVGLAVLDIVEGDPEFWNGFQNADDFAGEVPYFVVVQQTHAGRAGSTEPTAPEDVWPQRADGTNAEFLTMFGAPATDACALDLPDYDPATATSVTCLVATGTPDNPVTTAYYNGLGQFTVTYGENDIYAEQPIVWS